MQGFESMASATEAFMDQLKGELKEKFKGFREQQGMLDSFQAFAAAVDWKEPWLVTLLSVEAALLLSVLLLRRSQSYLAVVFFLAMAAIYCAQRINAWAESHWQQFATQNYFDSNGIFVSAVLSGPLLIIMFVILIIYLAQTSSLLIRMKRKELRYKARQCAAAAGAAGAGGGDSKKGR